jgi:hypothetical protein
MGRWETEHNGFRIRITEYQQNRPTLLYYFYYVFESMPVGASEWSEVMTFTDTDDVPIPSNQVRFVDDDRIAFFFMGWMYAVTTDGGRTWSLWNADKELPNCKYCNYHLIRDVQITPGGTGRMVLDPTPNTPAAVSELHTRDYGRHWTAE